MGSFFKADKDVKFNHKTQSLLASEFISSSPKSKAQKYRPIDTLTSISKSEVKIKPLLRSHNSRVALAFNREQGMF